MSDQITVAGVVEYARQLNVKADLIMRQDPYARPPYPTTAATRMLCSRKKTELLRALPDGATEEEREKACTDAPAAAKAELSWRWSRWEREHRQEQEDEGFRRKRHARRQRHSARDRQAAREKLTPGQRIDKALAEVSTVAAARAGSLEPPVSGSHEQGVPTADDPAVKVRAIARDAVSKIEDELESCRRRRVELEEAV